MRTVAKVPNMLLSIWFFRLKFQCLSFAVRLLGLIVSHKSCNIQQNLYYFMVYARLSTHMTAVPEDSSWLRQCITTDIVRIKPSGYRADDLLVMGLDELQ